MNSPRVISIEFNELCPSLMDRFIDEGHLPNFKRLRSESEVYVTDAEAEGEDLNPWVQWVTFHTGLSHEEHKIYTLSQGHLLDKKATWDLLSDAGYRVWVCSSMNPRADMPLNGFLLPDPWSTGVKPQPAEEFDPFFNYVRSSVQEHTQDGVGDAKQFIRYMLSHGVSPTTLTKTATQLISEKLGENKWKRAMVLDQFLFDVFRYYYKKHQPDFSTFFLNSTAHFQHCFWRHMEPERFSATPDAKEIEVYGNAIFEGYQNMDRIIGKFYSLAGDDATLIFSTALSQQPHLDDETTGGRRYYRLNDEGPLRSVFGIEDIQHFEPVMADQFILRFGSTVSRDAAKRRMLDFWLSQPSAFKNRNPQLLNALENDDRSLICQCRCTREVKDDATISGPGLASPVLYSDVFYQFSTIKSGRHHPDGMCWIRNRDGTPTRHPEKISLRQIAPMILKMFYVTPPSYMVSTGSGAVPTGAD